MQKQNQLNDLLIESAKNGYLEKVKLLIEQGADIHAGNDYALRLSADNGHLKVVKYLMTQGSELVMIS
jgi:ankyrin repeat protein